MNQIDINREYCKKCRICITFCPKSVFDKESERPEVVRPEDCIGCKMCEMRCPDFAITVTKGEN